MAQHSWSLEVTDAEGHRERVPDDSFPNPYVSDETAQQIAERLLSGLLAPLVAETPQPRAVAVLVWREKDAGGDPIAEAGWAADAS